MAIKVGINGFGRIGRQVFRIMEKDPDFEIVAINDPGKIESTCQLLKYDSVHGRCFDTVVPTENGLAVDGREVTVFHTRDPHELPWGEYGVEVVIESTGALKDREKAQVHLEMGAKKVVITSPAKGEDITIVMGVNDDKYDPENHHIVSNASCTTNCLAPFARVLCDSFGIKRGFMNTIHAYTGDQYTLDHGHKDLRRARNAATNVIPTTTGAAKAVALVLPQLKGKLDGFATRVPVCDGSMVDLTVELECEVTKEEVNAAMKAAAEGYMKGYLEYVTDPIVSSDVIGASVSSLFDSDLTMVLGGKGNLVKCVAWYDNEWGYSCRVVDLARLVATK